MQMNKKRDWDRAVAAAAAFFLKIYNRTDTGNIEIQALDTYKKENDPAEQDASR